MDEYRYMYNPCAASSPVLTSALVRAGIWSSLNGLGLASVLEVRPSIPSHGLPARSNVEKLTDFKLRSNSANVTTKLSPTSKIMPHPLSDSNDAAALSVRCKSVNSISYT